MLRQRAASLPPTLQVRVLDPYSLRPFFFSGRILEETDEGLLALVTSKEDNHDEYIVTIPRHLVPEGASLTLDSEFELTISAPTGGGTGRRTAKLTPLPEPELRRLSEDELAELAQARAEADKLLAAELGTEDEDEAPDEHPLRTDGQPFDQKG
jgi:hypothetical protein